MVAVWTFRQPPIDQAYPRDVATALQSGHRFFSKDIAQPEKSQHNLWAKAAKAARAVVNAVEFIGFNYEGHGFKAKLSLAPHSRPNDPLCFEAKFLTFGGNVYLVAMPGLDKDDVRLTFENKSLMIDGRRDAKRHAVYEDGGVSYWCIIPFDRKPPQIKVKMTRGTLKIYVEDDARDTENICWCSSGYVEEEASKGKGKMV